MKNGARGHAVPGSGPLRPQFGHRGRGIIGPMSKHAASAVEAVGSAAALIGIPAVLWLGFVGLIQAVTRSLGLF